MYRFYVSPTCPPGPVSVLTKGCKLTGLSSTIVRSQVENQTVSQISSAVPHNRTQNR